MDYLFDKNWRTTSLKFSISYEKDTTKDFEAKQLIKPWPYWTLSNQKGRNLLFETGHFVSDQTYLCYAVGIV